MSRFVGLTRSPLLRFAVAGALLFAVRELVARPGEAPEAPPERPPIVVSADDVRALEAAFVKRWGRAPSAAERDALIAERVQDEVLFREARRLALGRGDASVRRRLVELARAVSDDPARPDDDLVREALALGLDDDVVIRRLLAEKMRLFLQQEAEPLALSDEELARLLEEQRERFVKPATVTLAHLFLSRDARGASADEDAARLLADLRSGRLAAERIAEVADPLPLGTTLRGYTHLQLQGRFGKAFADRVFALEPGTWEGPIESPFGLHLVRIEERREERLPELDEVRSALLHAVRRERAQASLARGLARLRELYEVRIEDESPAPATDLASAR